MHAWTPSPMGSSPSPSRGAGAAPAGMALSPSHPPQSPAPSTARAPPCHPSGVSQGGRSSRCPLGWGCPLGLGPARAAPCEPGMAPHPQGHPGLLSRHRGCGQEETGNGTVRAGQVWQERVCCRSLLAPQSASVGGRAGVGHPGPLSPLCTCQALHSHWSRAQHHNKVSHGHVLSRPRPQL